MQRPVLLLVLLAAAGCKAKQQDSAAPAATANADSASHVDTTKPAESAVAPEVNPPGDIPDTQAFVNYASPAGGYQLDVPEGWARTENGPMVTFVNKIDGVKVNVASTTTQPTASSVRANEVKQLEAAGHAVKVTGVSEVTLPAGKAVVVKYTSNSDPNAVTNKQLRLENEAYIYFRNGKAATLTLWAPQGADNVDQWNRMSKSFRWR